MEFLVYALDVDTYYLAIRYCVRVWKRGVCVFEMAVIDGKFFDIVISEVDSMRAEGTISAYVSISIQRPNRITHNITITDVANFDLVVCPVWLMQ